MIVRSGNCFHVELFFLMGLRMKIIGRQWEKSLLTDILESNKPEFLVIHGRRRIGKTYLIREFFEGRENAIFFNITGSKNTSLTSQIGRFTEQIGLVFYNLTDLQSGKNWEAAFKKLTEAIGNAPMHKKIILFLDEFPWLATKNSRLLGTLDYYWNHHWSRDPRIKLILCGSSASWIVKKIINNRGGLHNRITQKICLLPFTLAETKEFLEANMIYLDLPQIVQLYMVMGGIPYYLNHVKKGLSVADNVDYLAFQKDGILRTEFDNLFASLFDNYEDHIRLIRLIALHRYGIGQEEILKSLWKNSKGSTGLEMLKNLEHAGFIQRFKPYAAKRKGIYYKIIDEYTLFYLDWIEPILGATINSFEEHYWYSQINTPKWHAWAGYAFESICYKHVQKIKEGLKIKVPALASTWRFAAKNTQGAQVDLLFDRMDDTITLCEIKFTNTPFLIDKTYAINLEDKINIFKKVTQTQKQIFLSMISAQGLASSKYNEKLISGVVSLSELF